MNALLGRFLIAIVVVAASACASDGTWVRTLPDSLKPPANLTLPVVDPSQPRVVTIRWPAVIAQNARGALVANYKRYTQNADGYTPPDISPAFVEMVSTFYTGELYWAIKRWDPSVVVLLEPQLVTNDGSELIFRPMVDSSIPVDLSLSLFAFTSSNAALPLLVDVISIAASSTPERSPGNCGLLIATMNTQATGSSTECSPGGPRLKFTHWALDGSVRQKASPEKFRLTLPLNTEQTLLLPAFVEGEANLTSAPMSEYRVKSVTPPRDKANGVTIQPLISDFAGHALSIFNVLRAKGADTRSWALYATAFDQALGSKLSSGAPLNTIEEKNFALLRRLYAQELVVRARRDETIARDIVAGPFGADFRSARAKAHAEYGGQMAKMMATTAASIVAGGAAVRASTSALTLLSANNSTFDNFNRQMEAVGMEYVQKLSPTMSSLERGSLDLLDGSIGVSIGDQAGLRAALKDVYDRRKLSN